MKLFSLVIFTLLLLFKDTYLEKDTDALRVVEQHHKDDKSKPNVIVILSDDQGYGDFSCHGNPILRTPALDKLYGESIRFDNFHVTPLCTPTRGQLMTGLDALHNKAATVLTGRNILRRDIKTMPEIFRENGYATGIFGKWHLGNNYPDRPMDRGFDKCVWHKGWGLLSETEYDNDYYETRYLDSLKAVASSKYCTNLWFDKAMEWMGEKADKDQPFFTYLALNAPHGPFQSPAQDFEVYEDKLKTKNEASFYGMIRNIDRNMSHLEKWLNEKGLKENTLIIFMNDNGSPQYFNIYNAGMRGRKTSNYEGGHRAACFVRWPKGALGNPRTVSFASEVQDLLPTFIDLLGLKNSARSHFDGISLSPLLKEGKNPADRMFVVQYGGSVRPEKYFSCVVWNSWRLIGSNELYDLDNDPGQQHNIAELHPDVIKLMKEFYDDWWAKVEPETNSFVPLIVGSEQGNPVIINSDYWEDGAVNTQWAVAQAKGSPRGGTSHIHISKAGRYLIQLSRWPFHIDRKLTENGPSTSIGGSIIREGKALPIEFGCASINDRDPLIIRREPDAKQISLEMDLPVGDSTFKAWFKDKDSNDLCGAYYVKIERI